MCVNVCWLLTLLLYILYDAAAIYVRCVQFLLVSSDYRFQMVAPCTVSALFRHLGWLISG